MPPLARQRRDRGHLGPDLAAALARCRRAFLAIGLFSGVINVMALTGSIYMLQLYDRVLPSHSVPTLIGLTLAMLLLYAGLGVFDFLRTRMMSRIGVKLDRSLRDRVTFCMMLLPLRARASGDGLQPVRDLDQIRAFMSGAGPVALFDLPWTPFYLGLTYLLHPWLGLLGAAGAVLLVALMLLTETSAQQPSKDAADASASRHALGEALRRNAEVVRVLGMGATMSRHWSALSERLLSAQVGAADISGGYGSVSKVVRMALQSGVLGLGAYLAIRGEATAGAMIAASILVSRGLAPIEIAIANWRGFIAARQGTARLSMMMDLVPPDSEPMALPRPAQQLAVEGIWVAAPGAQSAIVRDVSFRLAAGDGLGVIGPAAAGKSTLARALVGAWAPQRGRVRLDGAALDQWSANELGRHIGYLPQSIELFSGTVAQNIARFDNTATNDAVITAAAAAGVHDLILRLPKGYETEVGEGGTALSGGQRQRVALARALFGDPFLVVLDEPNSNLDSEGDAALTRATAAVQSRGGIVVVIAHRPSAIAAVDKLLVLSEGQVQALGPKEEVLRKAVQGMASTQPPAPRFKVVNEGPLGGGVDA